MLEEESKSAKYSAVPGNLKEGGSLTGQEVDVLINDYISERIIVLDSVSEEKAVVVSEALMDNHDRLKST